MSPTRRASTSTRCASTATTSPPRSSSWNSARIGCSISSRAPDGPERFTNPMSIRVVIAEDEAIIRMDLRETLEEEGYEVVGETGNGDQAIELVRELLPDLAILDVKMPGKDGLEVARLINNEKL